MDRDLLGYPLNDHPPLRAITSIGALDPRLLEGGSMGTATIQNGSQEHQKIREAIEAAVRHEVPKWSIRISPIMILDLITIACIAWLLTR